MEDGGPAEKEPLLDHQYTAHYHDNVPRYVKHALSSLSLSLICYYLRFDIWNRNCARETFSKHLYI